MLTRVEQTWLETQLINATERFADSRDNGDEDQHEYASEARMFEAALDESSMPRHLMPLFMAENAAVRTQISGR